MDDRLTLAVCNFLAPEISEILSQGDYPDVRLISFNANCTSNSNAKKSIDSIIHKEKLSGNDLIVLGGTCLENKSKFNIKGESKIITFKQCFEPILNYETILYFIQKGYYLATNGWLRSLKNHKHNWGFKDKINAGKFFSESMNKILFLDTLIPGDYLPNLTELSEYMDLPYEILPVGLDTCRLYIDSIILKWRNENERKSFNQRLANNNKKSSDLLLIFNQLELLVNLTEEDKIIDVTHNLLTILFAPQRIRYTKYLDGNSEQFEIVINSNNSTIVENSSFEFEISYSNELYGFVEVMGVAFPEYIKPYMEMAYTISQLLSISIANARKYSQIIKQKDQIEHYSNELKKSNLTKDKFFSIIAHDLKSPFSALIGFSDLLLEDINNKNYKRLEHYANIINIKVYETFNLLVNLLEWARSQQDKIKFEPEYIDVSKVLSEVRNLLIDQADKKNIFIKLDFPEYLQVFADRNMFKTIFRNLINNAIKFSNPNDIIRVSADIKPEYIQITVVDHGVGMTNETANNLFDLSTTNSNDGTAGEKGTGLGLIICKEFMDEHKGKIWVESKINEGSTFYLNFPEDSD